MLPLLVDEEDIFIFKFWFDNSIQDGMLYRNEMYRRLKEYDIVLRPQVYHLGCRLARKTLIVLSFSQNTCSLWANLRDPSTNATVDQVTQTTTLIRSENTPLFKEQAKHEQLELEKNQAILPLEEKSSEEKGLENREGVS